jgi:pilus assembly protein CpaC
MISKYLKNIAFAVFTASVILTPCAYARDAVNITKQKPTETLTLQAGKGDVVQVGSGVADVLVSDPSIVEVGPVKDNQLYLIGSKIGDTNVLVFDKSGGLIKQIAVHVKSDTSKLEESMKQLFPHENITVDALGDKITLKGTVSSADVAARAKDLAMRFVPAQTTVINNLGVQGNQQVMIHVKIVEVARNVLNELGLETDVAGVNSGNFSAAHVTGAASTGPLTNNPEFGLTVDPSFGNGALIYDTGSTGPISLIIHALERDGMVNTLAQPNLTAISGENARFLAGGEFPIPSQRDNNGNITYEYRPFGISLAFKPIVLDKNRINLQISTEVSEVSTELTLQLPGISVPSFTVRRAETTVEMASGGSLMIAGLIESKAIERMNRLPGIGDVPVLGALVRSESFNRNESELLVIISAYLVEPFAERAAVRTMDTPRLEPLNRALAESLAIAYGESVNTYANNRPFGFITQ